METRMREVHSQAMYNLLLRACRCASKDHLYCMLGSLSLSCVEEAITYLRGRCFVGLQEELQKGWSVGRQVEPLLSVAPLDI
jgi:hypothetical protein